MKKNQDPVTTIPSWSPCVELRFVGRWSPAADPVVYDKRFGVKLGGRTNARCVMCRRNSSVAFREARAALGGLRALQTPKTAPSLLLRLSVGAAVSNTERSERTARTVGVTKGWVRMAEATQIRNETTKQKTNADPVGVWEEREKSALNETRCYTKTITD